MLRLSSGENGLGLGVAETLLLKRAPYQIVSCSGQPLAAGAREEALAVLLVHVLAACHPAAVDQVCPRVEKLEELLRAGSGKDLANVGKGYGHR